ncbi:methylated-DNA--[protein]-cysteine S-methyltransferase [Stenotrophomonas maltophilia]|uniref:Methylated-DNA--protein-cysteine methyltransferase n=1 Tax=Stenotrophomonas pavanii TaxID=487698 RepID=A0ABN6GQ34_9GAMM|nr:methylated-DNA--[protein]-cysteine S-methyltransferase [Stenotrophomonas pavanii]MBH1387626.1 methylated-DNA--[protein]-cysteine S-methyltransferase [Stenotrophomonas maltophilia]UGB16527.1 methylated-DNA--[protein]-cysteine S-methyltransferase [Stenotrophomonas maltophilia]UGB51405.1 methylated-DNA--[protein]-cysteine S-methyltransferase [Stenotrophomonas maltophilia]BCX43156.1 methylated-DNA--[protein]-cysteine S-methyltransferase [Stenotrophomonas pavanii]
MTLLFDRFDSPIGVLTIAGDERGLSHVLFPENRHPARGRDDWHYAPDALPEAREQLLQFLHGERRRFDLRLAPRGTPFQLRVWQALALIPFGQTWSYLQLAQHLGQPSETRAVGAANGRNPLPIILPCHRVIGSNGALTGFGGGLETKAALLRLEQRQAPLFA